MNRRIVSVLILLLILLIPAFAQEDTSADRVIGPDTYPPGVNPLTGLPVEEPTVLEQRPVIVKIVNAPAEARPQWHLFEADLIWEYVLSGGITRLAAIFYSQSPDHVGPIRSLRMVDFELTRLYDSLIVTSGMSTGTLEYLRADELMPSRIISGIEPAPALYRDPDVGRSLDLTLFGNIDDLRTLAADLGRDMASPSLSGMAFSVAEPTEGWEVDQVTVTYADTQVVWSYDAARGWVRFQDGEPHFDAARDEQFYTDNVLIIEEDHNVLPYTEEQFWGYTNFAYIAPFIGSGRAVLLRDGRAIEGEWRRPNRNAALQFYDESGQLLLLKPGRTFVNLVPRWQEGYHLTFNLVNPPTASVTTPSVNLRTGPGVGYGIRDAAFEGDTLSLIGRNNNGTWVQVWYNEVPLWVRRDLVRLNTPVEALPLVRPTVEF